MGNQCDAGWWGLFWEEERGGGGGLLGQQLFQVLIITDFTAYMDVVLKYIRK